MNIKTRYSKVIEWFEAQMPLPKSELHYENPFQLLIATILAAQCTDKRINIITPPLFRDFPTPEVLAASNPETIFEYIRTATYPNSKAKHLVGMAQKLVADYGGKVPSSIDELQTLPGVGKKTANVVASVAFDVPALAVDTHVFRVANRIGLTNNSKTPVETERELTQYIPKRLWSVAHHWLILHGRYVCIARKPKCESCGLLSVCERNGV